MNLTQITALFTALNTVQYGSPLHEEKLKGAVEALQKYHRDAIKRQISKCSSKMADALRSPK